LITNFKANYYNIKFQISLYSNMISSTKRDISHDLRQIEPKHSRSSRLNRKHLRSYFRKYSTSTEAKLPKIVKSSSFAEKLKLETLYSPNKGSSKVIKSHEDSENSNRKSSSKTSFWSSPDLIKKSFSLMELPFERSCCMVDYKRWIVRKWRLRSKR
jgi:hypothetical protein